jgi:probable biosynthetic protein (TIGR04098 family)
VVGVGSVVVQDVPAYGIVLGNPARLVRKRFSDDVIEALQRLRWWDLPNDAIRKLRPLLQGEDVDLFIRECSRLKGLPAPETKARHGAAPTAQDGLANSDAAARIVALIQRDLPKLSSVDLDRPLQELGIDSFGMLTLRTEIEAAFALAIDDQTWTSIVAPADLVRIVSMAAPNEPRPAAAAPAVLRRSYQLNMPQMAQSGLSESWLFKEAGDLHWSLIAHGLRSPPSRLADDNGERLYATFTRIALASTCPLAGYREDESVTIEAKASRYGAGIFFSDATLDAGSGSVRLTLMSSFAKYGKAGANTSLLKGQPHIPPNCAIPPLPSLPEFGEAYRAKRGGQLPTPVFECEYEILPPHDINGVGLLYFAAYPVIVDICTMRHAGRAFATHFSTRRRDIFYFANSDADETLIFRIHQWRAGERAIEFEASLSRKSDGVLMAYGVTSKDRIR